MIFLWVLEREFDFGLIFWLLAFLLPALARFVSFLVRLAARVLGRELPGEQAGGEPAGEAPDSASEPDFPVFEELGPFERPAPEPVPEPAGAPRPPAARELRRLPVARSERRPLAPSLEEPAPAVTVSSLDEPTPRALSSLSSGLGRTREPAAPVLEPVSDPELRAPLTLGEWRRAILLQEILAPPLSLRREHRPGQLAPFEFDPTP